MRGVTYMSSSSSFPSSSSCCSFSWLFLIPGSEEIKITTGCSRRGSINGSQEQQQVGWLNTSDVQERERESQVSQSGIPCGQIMWPSSSFDCTRKEDSRMPFQRASSSSSMHTYRRNPLLVYIKRTKQEKRQGEESWRRKKEIKREACIFSYSCWDMWAAARLC